MIFISCVLLVGLASQFKHPVFKLKYCNICDEKINGFARNLNVSSLRYFQAPLYLFHLSSSADLKFSNEISAVVTEI